MHLLLVCLLIASSVAAAEEPKKWYERVHGLGDFRYRHEYLSSPPSPASQHRDRIRLRAGVEIKISDTLMTALQLATGSPDPVSTNLTLDGAYSRKATGLDLAYLAWMPLPEISLQFGKFKQPFFRPGNSQLLWDSDLSPEGINFKYDEKFDGGTVFVILPFHWLKERGTDVDTLILGGQVGFVVNTVEKDTLTLGVSYFNFMNMKGQDALVDNTKSFGNTVYNRKYVYGYIETEAFAEYAIQIFNLPSSFFFDFVTNSAALNNNSGWLGGLSVGRVKDAGSWSVRYAYRVVGADAVVGALSDSDFRGGGTNGQGHDLSFEYALTDKFRFNATYFKNALAKENMPLTYNRLQLDISYKY